MAEHEDSTSKACPSLVLLTQDLLAVKVEVVLTLILESELTHLGQICIIIASANLPV